MNSSEYNLHIKHNLLVLWLFDYIKIDFAVTAIKALTFYYFFQNND